MLAGQLLQTERRDGFVGVEARPTEVSNALRLYQDKIPFLRIGFSFFFQYVSASVKRRSWLRGESENFESAVGNFGERGGIYQVKEAGKEPVCLSVVVCWRMWSGLL